ncbi:MAG: hypothetical protein ACREOI_21010 [bacterium]
MIKPIIKREKLASVLNEITAETGEPYLFGLFLRTEAPNVWDLVVASPWLEKNRIKAMSYLADKVKAYLTSDELLSLSRIVILESHYPVLKAIFDAIPSGKEQAVFRNEDFLGLEIKRAYVLKAKRPQKNDKMPTNKKPRQRTAPARRRIAAA